MNMKNPYKYLYALECENNSFYIGQTNDLNTRLKEHLEQGEKSSAWTKLHKAIAYKETWSIQDYFREDALNFEDKMTLIYINEYGWKNVRGGRYIYTDEKHHFELLKRYNTYRNNIFTSLANKTRIDNYLKAKNKLDDLSPIKNHPYIFILKLENNKLYIGYSSNIHSEIKGHFYSFKSNWTSKYKPIELLEIYDLDYPISNYKIIDKFVLYNMQKYGVENVRGGIFTEIDNQLIKEKIIREYPNYFLSFKNDDYALDNVLGNKNAVDILTLIVEGANPLTYEIIDEEHFLNNKLVKKSIYKAIEALKGEHIVDLKNYAFTRLNSLKQLKKNQDLEDYQIQKRKEHPRAYEYWTLEEDYWLQRLIELEVGIYEMIPHFKRPYGAIKSRIEYLKF